MEDLILEATRLYSNDASYIALFAGLHKLKGESGLMIDRQVVVKSFLVDTVEDDDMRKELLKKFFRESRIHCNLSHNNILTAYGYIPSKTSLVLEKMGIELEVLKTLFPGVDVNAALSKRARKSVRELYDLKCILKDSMSWKLRIELALDVAHGLQYLHSKGIKHLDIKPQNVLVKWDEILNRLVAKIADFGESRVRDKVKEMTKNTSVTKDGKGVGTVPYMSPESLGKNNIFIKIDFQMFSYFL